MQDVDALALDKTRAALRVAQLAHALGHEADPATNDGLGSFGHLRIDLPQHEAAGRSHQSRFLTGQPRPGLVVPGREHFTGQAPGRSTTPVTRSNRVAFACGRLCAIFDVIYYAAQKVRGRKVVPGRGFDTRHHQARRSAKRG